MAGAQKASAGTMFTNFGIIACWLNVKQYNFNYN